MESRNDAARADATPVEAVSTEPVHAEAASPESAPATTARLKTTRPRKTRGKVAAGEWPTRLLVFSSIGAISIPLAVVIVAIRSKALGTPDILYVGILVFGYSIAASVKHAFRVDARKSLGIMAIFALITLMLGVNVGNSTEVELPYGPSALVLGFMIASAVVIAHRKVKERAMVPMVISLATASAIIILAVWFNTRD